MKLQIEYIPTSELIPYQNNPRKNDKAIDVVAKSIKKFGFLNPIILDKNNEIVAGHTRLQAAKKLGLKEVPIIWAENLTDAQVKAFRIMDNKSQEYAKWDLKILVDELKDIQSLDIDLEFTGIPESELNRLLKDNSEKVDDEKPVKYQIEKGDVWKLGDNILICGDSTKPETFKNIEDVNLVFTDPPYGVSYTGQIHYNIDNPKKGSGKQWKEIEGDDLRGDKLYEFLRSAFAEINKKLVKKGAFYCFYASRNHIIFEKALNDAGLTVKQILIWNKQHVLGRSDYHWCHEPIMYGHKTGENCTYYGDRLEKTILNKPLTKEEINDMNEKEIKKLLKSIVKNSEVWTEKKDAGQSYIHPTQKPIGLAKRAIINSCPKDGIVLDPFGGSGSTLMACEKLNRKSYTIEFSPEYCSHIIERWENSTGNKGVKVNKIGQIGQK